MVSRRSFLQGVATLAAVLPILGRAQAVPVPASAPVPPAPKLDARPFELHEEPENWLNKLLNDLLAVYRSHVFDTADSITRTVMRTEMASVMNTYVVRRRIYEFQVICDASNNPPSVVDAHDIRIDVEFEDTRRLRHSIMLTTSTVVHHVYAADTLEDMYTAYHSYSLHGTEPLEAVTFPDGYVA
jgi:hypothetical protein